MLIPPSIWIQNVNPIKLLLYGREIYIVLLFTWNTMFAWQYGPENEMGPTRNSYSAGTINIDASILHAAAHAAWNACDAP